MRVSLFFAAAAITMSAQASIVDFTLSGTVSFIDDSHNHINGAFGLNDPFTATLEYDSDASPGSTGTYPGGIVTNVFPSDGTGAFMTVSIGSSTYTGNTGYIQTNFDGLLNHTVFVSNNPSSPSFGTPPGGGLLELSMMDTLGAGGQLPGVGDFASLPGTNDQFLIFQGTFPGDYYQVNAYITGFTAAGQTAAPEPATIVLFAAGLMGICLGGCFVRRTSGPAN